MLLHPQTTSWNKKSIVFIHGIGRQPQGFSQPLYELLRAADPATADAARWHEVAYDSVNDAMEAKVTQFQGALAKGGKDSMKAVGEDFLVDLLDFMFNVDPYNWINNVTKKALVDVLDGVQPLNVQTKQHEIFIIAHSLGTVVAYETLHDIIDMPQALGLSSNFRVKALFTLGCPLAFIKANQGRIPSINQKFYLRNGPIGVPTRVNTFTGATETNVTNWHNLRQAYDPVASLVPLDQKTANGALSEETQVFDAFLTGLNPHDFANYITQYAGYIMGQVRA